jgi:hypothetical protein
MTSTIVAVEESAALKMMRFPFPRNSAATGGLGLATPTFASPVRLRVCQEISVSTYGQKSVVPVAMESVSPEAEFGHLLIGNLNPCRVGV